MMTNYDRERAMYEQECTEEMIRMRRPGTSPIRVKSRQSFAGAIRRDEPMSPACTACREPGGTCFPEPCKLYEARKPYRDEAKK